MRVLHVCATDAGSGAAIAAYRFHAALKRSTDIDSKMLVASKRTEDDDVILLYDTFLKRMLLRFRKFIDELLSGLIFKSGIIEQRLALCTVPYSLIVKKVKSINPDIVHFHWIHDGILYIRDLEHIPVTIFCTMHDTWYASLGQYIKNEENVDSYANSYFFKVKKKVYLRSRPVFVAVSDWMRSLGEGSYLLKDLEIKTIHNCIDTDLFKPVEKKMARNIVNLPEAKIVLFGASNYSKNKGEDFINGIIDHFSNRSEVVFVFIGRKININKKNVMQVGQLADPLSLILYYSSASVLVSPSFQESFGLVIAEAMACGTPVVAFNATGPKDIIDHKLNGYLAAPYEITDLIYGIEWILDHEDYETLTVRAVEKVRKSFSYPVIAGKLANLYKNQLVKS